MNGSIRINGKQVVWQTTFPDYVNFKCIRCNACCIGGFYEVLEKDIKNISKFSGFKEKEFVEIIKTEYPPIKSKVIKSNDKGVCMFLKEKNCTVYPNRPYTCRTFPFKLFPGPDGKIYIDLSWECIGIVQKEFTEKDECNYDDLVRLSYEKLKKEIVQMQYMFKDIEKYRHLLDKKSAEDKCWNHIYQALMDSRDILDIFGLLTNFELKRKLPILKFSNVDKYIEDVKKAILQPPQIKWDEFMESQFEEYKIRHKEIQKLYTRGRAINNGEVYHDYPEEDCIIFEFSGDHKIEVRPTKIKRKIIDKEAKELLVEYLTYAWNRKFVEFEFLSLISTIYQKKEVNPYSFTIKLEITKGVLRYIQFYSSVISEKNKHETISKEDVMESIFVLDSLVFNMVHGSMHNILRMFNGGSNP